MLCSMCLLPRFPRVLGSAGASWLALAGGLVLGVGAGCSGEPAVTKAGNPVPAAQPGGPLQRDTLVIATVQDAQDMLYLVSQSTIDAAISEATNFQPMDADFNCKLTHDPQFAASWQFSDDGKSITVHLREDITWEDGKPVSADDYKFTYDLAADPAVASPRLESLALMVPDARPRVIDAHTVRFDFKEAYDRTTMLSHIGLPLVPRHVLDLPGLDRASLRGHVINSDAPLASGPWRVASWERNAKLVLEPNPKFTGPKSYIPKLKRVIFKVIPEYANRLIELESGSVDLMEQVQVSDADKLAADHPEIQLKRRGWRGMDTVLWNTVDSADHQAQGALALARPGVKPAEVKPNRIFGDRAVRRALASALDVDKLIKDLLTSQVTGAVYGRPAIGTITPSLCGAHNDNIQRFAFDPASTIEQLKALGWADTNGDGWLDKDGLPMRFTMITNTGNQRRAKAAIIIQANLKAIGADMQIEQLETNTFFERLRSRDFDAALSGWSAGLLVDPGHFWAPHSEFNFTSYHNPRVDELIATGMSEPDYEKAKPLWHELQQTIYDDQPYAFLYWMDEIVAVNGRFQNAAIDISSPYRKLYQWSVAVDKVKYLQ